MKRPTNAFDCFCALDFRYWEEEMKPYLSENAFHHYKCRMESALVEVLYERGICPESAYLEISKACTLVTTDEVYEEEETTRHDVRALVNRIRRLVGDKAKPYVHMTATSYDIVDTANAARFRDAVFKVLIPQLIKLEKELIIITRREAQTPQVGRTHGQHAVPITFGFAMAEYVSRLGNCIGKLETSVMNLRGKFSGAVGAYNASSLFVEDPQRFEWEVLKKLDLLPAEHSTQIAPPEAMTTLLHDAVAAFGVMANLSDDMRHLQRTEIAEVGEEFLEGAVGSSTMSQKINPIGFENGKSMWKIVMPRMVTVYMDQISEHQRDLTNSASSRTYGEIICYAFSVAKRLTKIMSKMQVNRVNMAHNLAKEKDLVCSEPLQLILGALGHPDAYDKVKGLTKMVRTEGKTLQEVAMADPETWKYLKEKATVDQRKIISDPSLYTGIATQKALSVAEHWERELGIEL